VPDDAAEQPPPAPEPSRTPEQHWREIFQDWRRSGLKPRAFCDQRGLTIGSFSYWRYRIRRLDGPPAAASAKGPAPPHRKQAFIPVHLGASAGRSAAIEVVLRGGRCLRVAKGTDEALLRMVVGVLEGA
jgi:hypothetical protein